MASSWGYSPTKWNDVEAAGCRQMWGEVLNPTTFLHLWLHLWFIIFFWTSTNNLFHHFRIFRIAFPTTLHLYLTPPWYDIRLAALCVRLMWCCYGNIGGMWTTLEFQNHTSLSHVYIPSWKQCPCPEIGGDNNGPLKMDEQRSQQFWGEKGGWKRTDNICLRG